MALGQHIAIGIPGVGEDLYVTVIVINLAIGIIGLGAVVSIIVFYPKPTTGQLNVIGIIGVGLNCVNSAVSILILAYSRLCKK
jgi:hypothetical protein